MKTTKTLAFTLVLAFAVCCFCSDSAHATAFNLTNGAGFADGDTGDGLGFDQLANFGGPNLVGTGVVDHLFEQNLYADAGGGLGTQKITDLPILAEAIGPMTVDVTYAGPGYELDWSINLVAPNKLNETIVIRPLTNIPEFRLFEYTDYDVQGTAGGDDANLVALGHIRQVDNASGVSAEVMVVGPTPTNWEIDGFPTLLNNIESGFSLLNVDNGPADGDNTFAFEWQIPLGVNQPITIEKMKSYVPEPSGAALAMVGILLGLYGRRRS